jgi:two-component system KDP operon response regulator KdpE
VSDEKPRVLVVEDDPEMRKALSLNLTARGYRIVTAATGSAALDEAAAMNPDVIVLDLGLPDMDGMDIIQAIRGYSRTPIVVLSGRLRDEALRYQRARRPSSCSHPPRQSG